jgi:hypothetical protein
MLAPDHKSEYTLCDFLVFMFLLPVSNVQFCLRGLVAQSVGAAPGFGSMSQLQDLPLFLLPSQNIYLINVPFH